MSSVSRTLMFSAAGVSLALLTTTSASAWFIPALGRAAIGTTVRGSVAQGAATAARTATIRSTAPTRIKRTQQKPRQYAAGRVSSNLQQNLRTIENGSSFYRLSDQNFISAEQAPRSNVSLFNIPSGNPQEQRAARFSFEKDQNSISAEQAPRSNFSLFDIPPSNPQRQRAIVRFSFENDRSLFSTKPQSHFELENNQNMFATAHRSHPTIGLIPALQYFERQQVVVQYTPITPMPMFNLPAPANLFPSPFQQQGQIQVGITLP